MEAGVVSHSGVGPGPVGGYDVVAITGDDVVRTHVHLHGGLAPVRRSLPELIQLTRDRETDPGTVFDLELPLDEAAEGCRAMDGRRATEVLLTL